MAHFLEDFPADIPDLPELVTLARVAGAEHIVCLTISRPEVMNCLSFPTLKRLRSLFCELAADLSVRAIVITGSGEKAFCAGADLKERKSMPLDRVPLFVKNIRRTMDDLANLPQPTIGAINGVAFGGGTELLLACDLRVAAPHAQLGLTETSLAIIPGAGGTQRLLRLIGRARAKDLILTARRLDALEAERIGLVNKVFPQETFMQEVLAYARTLAQTVSPRSTAVIKAQVWKALHQEFNDALALADAEMKKSFASADFKEGVAHYVEKRAPAFTGA